MNRILSAPSPSLGVTPKKSAPSQENPGMPDSLDFEHVLLPMPEIEGGASTERVLAAVALGWMDLVSNVVYILCNSG